ncbi:NADH dehydrogenase [ubiquinone] 1 alpha subcomplex subunit 2-like [Vicia villosa]|uniref:NADH dehydrogenase [ubiquinone] 1 alpha subcomplex subunit 2-like n=1 Tax=Vicia villosa TaxID=3911 RepID=UPI00273C5DB3|nr:NADH dehydrogenase [ubiquinone] 1 alpha subcomplex subunit 2-like [Vicia villosa]
MAWRGHISKNIKELWFLMCQTSPASSSTMEFVEKNYSELKTLNPKLPILIRECSGVEPQLWARYDITLSSLLIPLQRLFFHYQRNPQIFQMTLNRLMFLEVKSML